MNTIAKALLLVLSLTVAACGEDPAATEQQTVTADFTAICEGPPTHHLCNQACVDCVKRDGCISLKSTCADACAGCDLP